MRSVAVFVAAGLIAGFSPASVFSHAANASSVGSFRRLVDLVCTLESGIDYVSNDIGSVAAASFSDCCAACSKTTGCGAFTWTIYNDGTCWLKSGRGQTTVNSASFSGVVAPGASSSGVCPLVEQGLDYVGNDISNAAGSNAADCCAKCSMITGCGAFTWSGYNGGTCWFKSGKGSVAANSGSISAVVSHSSSSCSTIEQNIDYVGTDIGSVTGSGAAECCTKCSARADCAAFTWTSYSGGTCWLKSGTGTRTASTGAVSGVVAARQGHVMLRLRSGEIPLRAVNLGGWLVGEYWMSKDSVMWQNAKDQAYQGEYGVMKHLTSVVGREKAVKQFEDHRSTWITEADIAEIASVGLNAVRVPIGFWIVNDDPSTTSTDISRVYAPGGLKYLDKLINDWALKYNIAVIISLHAHQGSQNGNDHSAAQTIGVTSWSDKQENVDNSMQLATFIAARYKNAPAFLGLNLMNEPSNPTNKDVLIKYYLEAYRRIRSTGNNCIVAISPLLQEQGPPAMMDFMPWPHYTNVWHEFHVYYRWGFEKYNVYQIMDIARGYRASTLEKWTGNWLLIGEWSLAYPDEAPFNDVNLLKEFAAIQLAQYEGAHSGWSFWSWRNDEEKNKLSEWSLRQLLRAGIFKVPRV